MFYAYGRRLNVTIAIKMQLKNSTTNLDHISTTQLVDLQLSNRRGSANFPKLKKFHWLHKVTVKDVESIYQTTDDAK